MIAPERWLTNFIFYIINLSLVWIKLPNPVPYRNLELYVYMLQSIVGFYENQ